MTSEWVAYKMGDVVEVTQGLAINAKSKHLFRDSGLPLLRISDLFSGQYLQFISEFDVPKQCIASNEELIYTRTGQVGFVFTNKSGVVHNNCFKVTPKNNNITREFLYWFLRQESVREHANKIASGSVQKDLTHSAFKSIDIKIPSRKVQYNIASILKPLDDRITLLRETNATLEAIAQALFKSWFVDFDPVRAKQQGQMPEGMDEATAALFPDSFEESESGLVPKGWQVKSFTETINVIGGGTPKTANAEYWNGNIPWFSVVDAPAFSDVFVIDTEKHISVAGVNNSSTKLLPVGTTIISARGTVGKLALTGEVMAMNQSCYGLSGKANDSYFTYFSTYRIVETLKQRTHGSVFDTITRNTLDGVSVIYPSKPAIEAFEDVISSTMQRIKENLKQTQTLANIRDTLLPRLISGQLRIHEAEAAIEEATA